MPTDIEHNELVERVDNLGSRLGGMESIASQHGERHADRGDDPIEGELVSGHSHAEGATPVVESTATSSSDSGTASHTVNLPSGIVSGDLLLVVFATDNGQTVTWPAGWESIFTKSVSRVVLDVGVRDADGNEGSTITVTTSGPDESASTSYRISGARTGGTADAIQASSGSSGNSATADPDSLTATGGNKNYLWIAFGGYERQSEQEQFDAAPTNYSNLLAADSGEGNAFAAGSAQRALNASSEDPGIFTSPFSGNWAAGTIAIYPNEASTHSGSADVHHNSFVGLQDNADSTIDPDVDDRIKVTDDGIVNADKSGSTLALSIAQAQISHGSIGGVSSAGHHVTSRPYTYSITFGWDPQSPQVFAP